MRMVALFYSISISCRCLCLLKWIQTNKLHQWKSFHFFFFRRIKYPVPLVRCISEWRWIRNSTYTHTPTHWHSYQKKNEIMMTGAIFYGLFHIRGQQRKRNYKFCRQCTYTNWIGNCVLICVLFYVLAWWKRPKKTNHKSNNNNSGHYGDWNK